MTGVPFFYRLGQVFRSAIGWDRCSFFYRLLGQVFRSAIGWDRCSVLL